MLECIVTTYSALIAYFDISPGNAAGVGLIPIAPNLNTSSGVVFV